MKAKYILDKKRKRLIKLQELLEIFDNEVEAICISPYKDINGNSICEEDILLKKRDRYFYEIVILKHGYYIDFDKDIDLFGWYLEIIEFTKIYQSRIIKKFRTEMINQFTNLNELEVIGNKWIDKDLLKPIEQYFS